MIVDAASMWESATSGAVRFNLVFGQRIPPFAPSILRDDERQDPGEGKGWVLVRG